MECCKLTLARFPGLIFNTRKSPLDYVRTVILEPTKLILVGTRITYKATGDAGSVVAWLDTATSVVAWLDSATAE